MNHKRVVNFVVLTDCKCNHAACIAFDYHLCQFLSISGQTCPSEQWTEFQQIHLKADFLPLLRWQSVTSGRKIALRMCAMFRPPCANGRHSVEVAVGWVDCAPGSVVRGEKEEHSLVFPEFQQLLSLFLPRPLLCPQRSSSVRPRPCRLAPQMTKDAGVMVIGGGKGAVTEHWN